MGGKRRKGRAGWEEDQILSSPSPSPLLEQFITWTHPSFLFAGGGLLPSLVDKKRKEKEPSSTSFPFSWQNNLSIPFS